MCEIPLRIRWLDRCVVGNELNKSSAESDGRRGIQETIAGNVGGPRGRRKVEIEVDFVIVETSSHSHSSHSRR